MNLFNVYPLMDITLKKAKGSKLWDENGVEYLDFYGGHAVISIGHSHPHYVKRIKEQLDEIAFYSNSVHIPIQNQFSNLLEKVSGVENYELFFCNSGAEANENALKLASFHTGKDHIIAFKKAFHGRTSGAVAITDSPKIVSSFNANHSVSFLDYDINQVKQTIKEKPVAAVIFEPITGVGGIVLPTDDFIRELAVVCKENGVVLIADEVQSGYGRSGKFFAHQYAGITPDVISLAKGMGNGFPVGAVMIHNEIKASYGLLGTTFGGNYLACAASLAVLEVIEQENLIENSLTIGNYLMEKIANIEGVKEVRGRGLMIGIEYDKPIAEIRNILLKEYHIFVGNSSNPNVIRLLPPMNIGKTEADQFIHALEKIKIS
jgi:acetylornithine/N-succinyldiaminopimelate aminotransferase